MARIPTYISDERLAGAPGVAQIPQATPGDFGAQIGVAQQQLGGAVTELAVTAARTGGEFVKRQDGLDTANAVAKFDFSKKYSELQTGAKDVSTFQQDVANAYDQHVDDYVNGLDVSEKARVDIKTRLMSSRPAYVANAEHFATKTLETRDKIGSNEGLTLQQNRVRSDGSIETYNDALAKSNEVIDAQPGTQQVVKDAMKVKARQDLAQRRFQGLIDASQDDPTALQGVQNELNGGTWDRVLDDKTKDQLLDDVNRRIKGANTHEAAAARTALQSLKQRDEAGVAMDPTELAGVQDAVQKSNRPELVSQFAMMAARQKIFRDGKDLPLSVMREEREKATKAKGVSGLPAVVQAGIGAGVAATNGTITSEYLAGLVNAEYGAQVGSGNYGLPTQNKTSSGAAGSDAAGIAQFTGATLLQTVKAHATEMGAANMSDAEILAKRADPEFSLKAAALHAQDNKVLLENSLGRPVTDGDLYFAHFLGVNGARRFIAAADASPKGVARDNVDAGQVDANRAVFFDSVTGKPRTNEQVRAYVANAMMNGPSRVDYATVRAWDKVIETTQRGLKEDPIAFAATTQKFADPGSMSTPEGVQRRAVVAGQVAEYYGIPTSQMKPLTKDEVEALGKRVQDGTADETLGVMSQVAGLGGDMAKAAFKQLGEKDSVFGYAAMLSHTGQQTAVGADIIRGEKRMRTDKDVAHILGQNENDRIMTFESVVGKALAGTDMGTQIRKAADALYIEREYARGGARANRFDTDGYTRSINAVLGGGRNPDGQALGNVNGAPMALPAGITASVFSTALDRMTTEDYARLSKWGGPPMYNDGKTATAREIALEGKFEAIGAGEYRIKMANNAYLLSGAIKQADGSITLAPYIFKGDPKALTEFATRNSNAPPASAVVLP